MKRNLTRLFTVIVLLGMGISCRENFDYLNKTDAPFKIIDENHNLGLDGDIIFVDAIENDQGNAEITYFAAGRGLETIEITAEGNVNRKVLITTDELDKNYNDATNPLPASYNDYKVDIDPGLTEFSLELAPINSEFDNGKLEVGSFIDYEVEIRFRGPFPAFDCPGCPPDVFHSYKTNTYLSDGFPLENADDYKYNSLDGSGVISAWDVTHDKRLTLSYRNFAGFGGSGTAIPAQLVALCNPIQPGSPVEPCTDSNSQCVACDCVDNLFGENCSQGNYPTILNRTYYYISSLPYDSGFFKNNIGIYEANPNLKLPGGHLYRLLFAFWPRTNRPRGLWESLPRYASGDYKKITIKPIKPGLKMAIDPRNFVYDRERNVFSVASGNTIRNLGIEGIIQTDLSFNDPKAKITQLTQGSNQDNYIRRLYKTGNGFTLLVEIVKTDPLQNQFLFARLNESLDTIFTRAIPKAQLSTSDFTPFVFDEDGQTTVYLFDALRQIIVKYRVTADGETREEFKTVDSKSPKDLTEIQSYAPGQYIGVLNTGTVVLFTSGGEVTPIEHPYSNITQARVRTNGNTAIVTFVSNQNTLVMLRFESLSQQTDNFKDQAYPFKSPILNHYSGVNSEGAFSVVQLKSTNATSEQLFFRTDKKLELLTGND